MIRMYDLILKKRNGGILNREEIRWMIDGYTNGSIPDYQMSAMMMAIYFQGMTKEETYELTIAMEESGDQMDLSSIPGIKADKHSTGGVGDKISLVLAPIMAALGVPLAKMSGRGLGHTGGTIDKLESIPGFTTELTEEQFIRQVKEIGLAIMGQTKDLAPADKLLYALRDTTATVDQVSLIASSIMSKKLAAGADVIVLDVKAGSGAFMKTKEDAIELASEMIEIGKAAGKKIAAVISNMDEPLGFAVGNALEVKEAIAALKGEWPEDLKELVYGLGIRMLILSGKAKSEEEAYRKMDDCIANRKALRKLEAFISAQGGDANVIENVEMLPKAPVLLEVKAAENGYVAKMNAQEIGVCVFMLGGGRATKESKIDPSVGIVLDKKIGDLVQKGDTLAWIHAKDLDRAKQAEKHFLEYCDISAEQPEKKPMIQDVLFS